MATVLFDNTNTDAVLNNGTSPFLGLEQPTLITRVSCYFFNGGAGAGPNAQQDLSLSIRDIGTGARFGPFHPVLTAGQGGVPNANAEFFPFIVLGPGLYEIIPTDQTGVPSTLWSQNPRSGGQGFTRFEGIPTGVALPPSGTNSPIAAPPTNEYERANWATNLGSPQTILSLQQLISGPATFTYMALYRITNSVSSSRVTVTTSLSSITLEPGSSVDVSTQEVQISSAGPAWGTYQNICCSLGTVTRPDAPVVKTGGGNGKNGNGGNGNNGNGNGGEDH